MRRDSHVLLSDVRRAADQIFEYVAGLDREGYRASSLVQAGVERKFQVIGEALNQLSKLDPNLARRIPDLQEIVAFRNVLVHGYAVIDSERVWRTIERSLPELHKVVGEMLEELS